MSKKVKTIIIAGGGTGGHIYPAIAIGKAIESLNSDVQVRYVGTAEGLESKIMKNQNLPLDLILSGKLNFSGNPIAKIKSIVKIPMGLIQSFLLILKYRPSFVLGVGGYASAPLVLAAALCGRKTALWEPNAHPGMANRWLSKIVKTSYLVFSDSKKYLSSKTNKVFGMPLRAEIEEATKSAQKKSNNEKLTILCFGGSQGSFFLNEKISDLMIKNPGLAEKIYLIHQTGTKDFQKTKNKYGNLTNVEVHEFIYDMPSFYKKSDIQFCRGGASTIAEASAFGVVPLIVPLPAADDHQLHNASSVVQANAGYVLDQKNFDEQLFKKTIENLIENKDLLQQMSANLQKLAPKGASKEIAHDILAQI